MLFTPSKGSPCAMSQLAASSAFDQLNSKTPKDELAVGIG